jgi:hypothetical protein
VVGDLRTEIRRIGLEPVPASVVAPAPTAAAEPSAVAGAADTQAQPEPTPAPTQAAAEAGQGTAALQSSGEIPGTVRATGNVRAQPQVSRDNVIGGVTEGDEVIFLGVTPDGQWFRVRLAERHASGSRITSDGGDGWVNRSLLSAPSGTVPTEQPPEAPAAPPEPTAAP